MKKALWQDSQTKFIDRVVKAHDGELYAERSNEGMIVIYRRGSRLGAKYDLGNNQTVIAIEESPQYVFALTDNWSTSGCPRDWGSEVVLNRLKKHDVWAHESFLAELERQEQKRQEIKDKDLKNQNEAWLSDNHSRFKKAFDGINTSSMSKSEKRRRHFDRSQELKQ